MEKIHINETFKSIDGEVNRWGQGILSTFLRFQGCNLKCTYCDSKRTWDKTKGVFLSVDEVMDRVEGAGNRKVTITGGEPLLQPNSLFELTKRLFKGGFDVSVETNGTLPLRGFNVGSWVVDCKLSNIGNGKGDILHLGTVKKLGMNDFIKFLVGSKRDFEDALDYHNDILALGVNTNFAYSPIHGRMSARRLLGLMQDHHLTVNSYLNVQIHKLIKVA